MTRYAIGLGRTPPDPQHVAGLADAWLAGLPGVGVDWLPGDELPAAP